MTGENELPGLDLRIVGQAGLVLLLAALSLAPLAVALARRIFPGRNVTFARWGFSHVAMVAVLVAFSAATLGALTRAVRPDVEGALTGELALAAVSLALGALGAAAVARKVSPEGARALGFHPGRVARALAAGVVSYAILLPGIVGIAYAWAWALSVFGVDPAGQAVLLKFVDASGPELPVAIALGVLVLPFFEELLFRGFLQPLLVQNFSEKGGVALTSFVFAALHGVHAFAPIFALSLLLGSLMLRTQRLVACWLVHALHNGLTLALVLLQPDGFEALRQGRLPW